MPSSLQVTLSFALLLFQISLGVTQVKNINWSCTMNVTDFKLNTTRAAGVWYEVARIPNVRVTECLNVTAPTSPANDNYTLEVDYYLTKNDQWTPSHEEVVFPWNSKTQNSYFELVYNKGTIYQVTVVFRLIFTDYDNVAVLCGFSGVSPVPLFKLMSRKRQVNPFIKQYIIKFAEKYDVAKYIFWDDQSVDKCVGGGAETSIRAIRLPTVFFLLLMTFSAKKVLTQT